jgi:hypothetical protein
LAEAMPHLGSGDLVVLGTGIFHLPENQGAQTVWEDIALIGRGPNSTTLVNIRTRSIAHATRLRIEGMRIECANEPFLYLSNGGTVHLRNCLITGYNSSAGGSNAIFTSDSVLLVEQCVFEGLPGRAEKSGANGGVAFDMRSQNWLYVRQTQFIDNDEILRAGFPCVFDGCRVILNADAYDHKVNGRGPILVRDSPKFVDEEGIPFELAADEMTFVQSAAGGMKKVDDRTALVIETLKLRRRLPYWIGLLRHENESVRQLAATHLARLIGQKVSASPSENAKDDDCLDENSVMLKAELEFARWMKWYEQQKNSLVWDEAIGQYPPRQK